MDPYRTFLLPDEESKFRSWFNAYSVRLNLDVNPDNPLHYYDYRGAWKAGITPDTIGHWPDTYKIPGHPTFSTESKYYRPGMEAGYWQGGRYISHSELMAKGIQQFADYEPEEEPVPPKRGTLLLPGEQPDLNPFTQERLFDADFYFKLWNNYQPTDMVEQNSNAFTGWLDCITGIDTVRRMINGKALGSALLSYSMEAISNFFNTMALIDDYYSRVTGEESVSIKPSGSNVWGVEKREGLLKSWIPWQELGDYIGRDAPYWADMSRRFGIHAFDMAVARFMGHFVPGTLEFMFDMSSGFTYSAASGAAYADLEKNNVFIGGVKRAMESYILGGVLHLAAPWKWYVRAPLVGSAFGTRGFLEAPEGKEWERFIEESASGVGMTLASGRSGRYGIRDIFIGAEPSLARMGGTLRSERGGGKPVNIIEEAKQRFTNPSGEFDLPKGTEYIRSEVEKALNSGIKVVYFIDNKPVEIVKVDPKLGLLDKKGQSWGVIPLLTPKHGSRTGIELIFRVGGKEKPPSGKKEGKEELPDWVTEGTEAEPPSEPVNIPKMGGKQKTEGIATWVRNRGGFKKGTVAADIEDLATRESGTTRLVTEKGFAPDVLRDYAEDAGLIRPGTTTEEFVDMVRADAFRRGKKAIGEEYAESREVEAAEREFYDRESSGETGGKQRAFLETARKYEETIDPETAERVGKIDPQKYIPEKNVEQEANAYEKLRNEGIEEFSRRIMEEPATDMELSSRGHEYAVGIKESQKMGLIDLTLNLFDSYDRFLRSAGRALQSAAQFGLLSPTTFVKWADRTINKAMSRYSFIDAVLGRMPPSQIVVTNKYGTLINPESSEYKEVVKYITENSLSAAKKRYKEFYDINTSYGLTKAEKDYITKEWIEIQSMPDGVDKTDRILKVVDMVAKRIPPSAIELIDAYRYSDMLSGPQTHLRNFYTDALQAFLVRPIDITTRGAIDFVESTLTGKDREYYVSDVGTYAKTVINTLPNVGRVFLDAFKMESSAVAPGSREFGSFGETEMKETFTKARMEMLPKSLTVTTRAMEAMDAIFSSLIGTAEYAIAKKAGLPDDVAMLRANEISQKYLFRNKLDPKDPALSEFSKALASLGKMAEQARKDPNLPPSAKLMASLMVPFIKTPINFGIQNIEHSPLGFLNFSKEGAANQEALAQHITGSLVTAAVAALVFTDQIETTWTAPTDPEEKKRFYAIGKKQFSIRVGDKWIPVWYLGPYALAAAIPMAVKHFSITEKRAMTADAFDILERSAFSVGRFLGNQTSAQSIGNLVAVFEGDLDISFEKQAIFTMGQFMPAQSLLRYVATIIDPMYRRPTSRGEFFLKDIPYLSQYVPPARGPMGEEQVRSWWNRITPWDVGKEDYIYASKEPRAMKKDREEYLLGKLTEIEKKLNNRDLTERERDKLMDEKTKLKSMFLVKPMELYMRELQNVRP